MAGKEQDNKYSRDVGFPLSVPLTSLISARELSRITTTPHHTFPSRLHLQHLFALYPTRVFSTILLVYGAAYWVAYFYMNNAYPHIMG